MDFNQDHFSLFDLPQRFAIDSNELDRRYREMQARVHPDRHAHLGDAEQRLAMQWSTQVNEAYRTLRQPLGRAEYLLSLAGIDVHRERTMPPDFLIRQMDWREAVEAACAASDSAALDHLHRGIKQEMTGQYRQLGDLFDDRRDHAAAAELVRKLMFQEKLLDEVDDALAVLDA
jgi:molecular chaperone HscB